MKNKEFINYKRCQKCARPFRNYEEANRCPFCKETKYVVDLCIKENNASNKT